MITRQANQHMLEYPAIRYEAVRISSVAVHRERSASGNGATPNDPLRVRNFFIELKL